MKEEYIEDLISVGKRLLNSGMVWGAEGSLSRRSNEGCVVITGAGARLGYLKRGDLVEVDEIGMPVEMGGNPSTEAKLHAAIYRSHPSVGAVVRVAPNFSTALGAMGFSGISGDLHVFRRLRNVARVPSYRPETAGFAGAVAEVLGDSSVALTEGFGVVAVGSSLQEAVDEVESLEMSAKILYTYKSLQGSPEG